MRTAALLSTLCCAAAPLFAATASAASLFWGDVGTATIKYANLDGTGSAVLPTTGATVSLTNSTVVDTADGRLYRANAQANSIAYANLDGTGGGGEVPIAADLLEEPAPSSSTPARTVSIGRSSKQAPARSVG